MEIEQPMLGPFITVVSVDGGIQSRNKLTVITPTQTHDAPLSSSSSLSSSTPSSRLSIVHEDAVAEENADESSSSSSSSKQKRQDEPKQNGLSRGTYVTVLALGKKQVESQRSNGHGQKKSVVNICSDENSSTSPHVVAILSKTNKDKGIGITSTTNGNGCTKPLNKVKSCSIVDIQVEKTPQNTNKDDTSKIETEIEEQVIVYKLPGERLGFGLRFDGGVTNPMEKVKKLFIQSCAPESPAARTETSWGTLMEGDEIVQIGTVNVESMTRMDCIQSLKDASVVVHLLVRHFYSPEEKMEIKNREKVENHIKLMLNKENDATGGRDEGLINTKVKDDKLNVCHKPKENNQGMVSPFSQEHEMREESSQNDHITTTSSRQSRNANQVDAGGLTQPAEPVQFELQPKLRHPQQQSQSQQETDTRCELENNNHPPKIQQQGGGDDNDNDNPQMPGDLPKVPPRKGKVEIGQNDGQSNDNLSIAKTIKPPIGFTDDEKIPQPPEPKVYMFAMNDMSNGDGGGHGSNMSICESDETGSTRSTVVSRLSMLSMNLSEGGCGVRRSEIGHHASHSMSSSSCLEGIEGVTSPSSFSCGQDEEEIPLAPPLQWQDNSHSNGHGGMRSTETGSRSSQASFQQNHSTQSSYDGLEYSNNNNSSNSSMSIHNHLNGHLLEINDDDELALLAEELGLGQDEEEDEAEELRKFLLLEQKIKTIHDKEEKGENLDAEKQDPFAKSQYTTQEEEENVVFNEAISLAKPNKEMEMMSTKNDNSRSTSIAVDYEMMMTTNQNELNVNSQGGNGEDLIEKNTNGMGTYDDNDKRKMNNLLVEQIQSQNTHRQKEMTSDIVLTHRNKNSIIESIFVPYTHSDVQSQNGKPLYLTTFEIDTKSNEEMGNGWKNSNANSRVKVMETSNLIEGDEEMDLKNINGEIKNDGERMRMEVRTLTTSMERMHNENESKESHDRSESIHNNKNRSHMRTQSPNGHLEHKSISTQEASTDENEVEAVHVNKLELETTFLHPFDDDKERLERAVRKDDEGNRNNSTTAVPLTTPRSHKTQVDEKEDGGKNSFDLFYLEKNLTSGTGDRSDSNSLERDKVNNATLGESFYSNQESQRLGTTIQGSISESNGMDSSQELYHHFVPFSPCRRGDPDGDEFPSWSDENSYDPKKVYRSELKMVNPPPPVPMSAPPEDEAPPPLPSSVPPKVVLARRSSSVEDKKNIFIAQQQPSSKGPSPMPRSSQEPSKKSVKDKIAMFSSRSTSITDESSTDGGFNTLPHGSTIRTMSTSTSSLPRSATALSKSSDNLLQGMHVSLTSSTNKPSIPSSQADKWKISQSTFDLSTRKNSTDSSSSASSVKSIKNYGVHGTNLTSTQNSYSTSKIMHERSQSMLDVGQENQQQQPSYQRVSSTYRYNNFTPKASDFSSTTMLESRRKANLSRLRGLVIPDKTPLTPTSSSVVDLPTIISKDAVIQPSSKMEQLKPRQVVRTESFDSYNNEKSAKIVDHDTPDWIPCAVPKYSPAFKRRSLTPYQSALSSTTTQKILPVTFNAGPTNYKTNTPDKSLESLASPHSDSSFEFSANPPLTEPRTKVFVNNTPPIVTARKPSLTKGTGNNNEMTTKDTGAEIHNSQSTIEAKNRVNDNNVHGTTKYNGKGDSDNDSAVSSSRSSISHGLSPPTSPTPEESSSTPDPDNSKPNNNHIHMEGEGDDSSNSDEGWRVLKPQSVEAINRKNVLASAKFSSGGGSGRADENSSGQSRRSDDDEADAEDTESSCSELDVSSDKKRRPSLTNRLGQVRRIPNSKVDTEEDEEDLVPSQAIPSSHSQQSSMDLGELILPELTESPLQAIYDMEVQMAYINEICDALPTRSESGNSRYFCRRDSEATVIERPIVKERKLSKVDQMDSGVDRRARNRSSSGNESDFSSSISVGSQHHSHSGVGSENKSSPQTTMDKPEEKWSVLEKKYSKSLTSVNLLGSPTTTTTTSTTSTTKHIEPTPPLSLSSQYSSNDGFEKSIDRMMEKSSSLLDSKVKAASTARIPRGRNDFKSLSEKWQQLTSDGTKQAVSSTVVVAGINTPTVTKPPLFEKPQVVTSSSYRSPVTTKGEPQNDVISPSHRHQHHQPPPPVVMHSTSLTKMVTSTNSSLPLEGDDLAWTPERRTGERHSNSSGRNSEIGELAVPMNSTKRSVSVNDISVNDIRRAFEKAEIAVNSYGRDDNCTMKNGSKDVDGLVPSAHFRVSSFDSTTSEESSATTPAGIYGSVNSLQSAPRDPYGSITSLASSTSLISPQELQQLIEDAIDEANQSLEEAGTPSHEVCVIILHREYAGGSLGITLAGGADYETKEITVHKVLTGSIADRDGRIHRGDRVLSINGKSTKGLTHREGLNLLKAPRTEAVLVVSRGRSGGANGFSTIEETSVTLDRAVEPLLNGTLMASLQENDEDCGIKWGPIKTVMLIKEGAGLGFSLEGGKGSINGDKPLTVKKIFVGGPAEKCGELQVGDLIVSINNVSMSSKSRTEAWNFMKKLGDGSLETEVRINVRSPIS